MTEAEADEIRFKVKFGSATPEQITRLKRHDEVVMAARSVAAEEKPDAPNPIRDHIRRVMGVKDEK